MFSAGNLHHALMHHALVARVHALVDLVDDTEGRLGHGLQGHEVENGGDGSLATGLPVGVELLQLLVFPVTKVSVGRQDRRQTCRQKVCERT